MNIDKPMLTQFVRDRKGQPRGMVVATVIDNSICVGWSYTNTKAGDRFNKQRAIQIALGRAEYGWGREVEIPYAVSKVFIRMADRASSYFKNAKMDSLINQIEMEYAEPIEG